MKNIQKFFLILILFSCFHSISWAEDANQNGAGPLTLSQVELGLDSAMEKGGFNSYGGIIRWIPEYRIRSQLDLGIDIGLTGFKYNNAITSSVIEYAISGKWNFGDLSVKAYVGAQTWTGGLLGTAFLMGPEVGYHLPVLPFLEGIYFSYTPVFYSVATVHEMSLGVRAKW